MRYASRIIEGYFQTEHRILGRVEYNVSGHRLDIRIPYFAPDVHVPSDDDLLGLNDVLAALAQQQDPLAQVRVTLHRVRQPTLDAKMLATLIGRNVPREGAQRVLRSLPSLLPTVRPDAPLAMHPGTLPAYLVGWHVYIKGPLDKKTNMSVKFKAVGGTVSRGDARRGVVADHGRCVQIMRPKGPMCVRVTLFSKRWVDLDEWRDAIASSRNRHVGQDVRPLALELPGND
jgi:hypothetical protein